MRVTENMRFSSTVNNLFGTQAQYNSVMEKLSSQKNVNRSSDNPIAATKIIELQQGMAANEQYLKNIDNSTAWISTTESNLSSAYDLLVRANEISVGQSTATANASTRKIAAQEVQSLIDEMGNLANAKLGDRYLFSGTRDDVPPFSTTQLAAKIDAAGTANNNSFQGTVTSSGTYTGTTNKTYALKITTTGPLAAATCQTSSDGGRTWNGTDLPMTTGSISFGDGVSLTFNDLGGTESFGVNDIFHVNATAAGYYQGNNEALSLSVNRGSEVAFNITGAQAFTAAGSNSADVFKTLNDLRDALNANATLDIVNQQEYLRDALNQVTLNQSLCGAKANHIESAKNNLSDIDDKMTALLSATQDADLADLATKLSIKQVALQASYAMAAKIGDTTIMNYIK